MAATKGHKIATGQIFSAWWPLAASWLLMSAELPAISAVVARLADPMIHLAAYGSVVFPLSVLIEAPVIMLLAASTALSRDWASYRKLRGYVRILGAALTLAHMSVAFTPLFDWVVESLMRVPPEIVGPSRIGMMIMTPWTWSIAYRRFNQGVLIRFGQSKAVSVGTLVRLAADLLILGIGYWIGSMEGIIVACSAVSTGVVCEAVFVGLRVRPVLRGDLKAAPPVDEALDLGNFLHFYVPLAMTSLLNLAIQPVGSAALSRMPRPLESLAVWPVVFGLFFMLRCLGHAYQEVVVALLDNPCAYRPLRSFARGLAACTSLALAVIAATPLSRFWFQGVSGLSPDLAELAATGIWFGLPLPGLSVFQNWYQGILVNSKKTRGITEAVVIYLITCGAGLLFGVYWGAAAGLFVGLSCFSAGGVFQVLWVWWRSRACVAAFTSCPLPELPAEPAGR